MFVTVCYVRDGFILLSGRSFAGPRRKLHPARCAQQGSQALSPGETEFAPLDDMMLLPRSPR
eukprot:422082-Amphidinium_carterae.1